MRLGIILPGNFGRNVNLNAFIWPTEVFPSEERRVLIFLASTVKVDSNLPIDEDRFELLLQSKS